MSVFATEFPAKKDIDRAKFAAASIAWVRGIERCYVLEEQDAREIHDDDVWLETSNGETLALKSFENDFVTSYGVRLEIPDNQGRRWRTECVYTAQSGQAFLRVRGQCVAMDPSAQVIAPKKPHFITQAINEGWAYTDGQLQTQGYPHFLSDADIGLAAAIIEGLGTSFLPSIYVSRNDDNTLPVDPKALARTLSGVGHVLVEPDRGFSFKLMEATHRSNPYGGAVGILAPNGKQLAKLFKRNDDPKGRTLAANCITIANDFVSSLAAKQGWEWQQLQEAQSHALREQLVTKSSDKVEEYMKTFDSEIRAKEEQIENLTTLLEIQKARNEEPNYSTSELLPEGLAHSIGPELYSGEFSDRLRLFIKKSVDGQTDELDPRTLEFSQRFLASTEFTGRSVALSNQIKSACRDGNQIVQQLGPLLTGFGYSKTQEGKHPKFVPPSDLFGLPSETFPSTPSDSQRAGKNRASDIIKNIDLRP